MDKGPAENNDVSLYHFSKKVVLLSFIFLMANATFFAISVFGQRGEIYREIAPRLVFSTAQDILWKGPYQESFTVASPDQTLFAGTTLKSGKDSFAEIRLGENTIRLGENTEALILDGGTQGSGTMMTLELKSGTLWINAFDPILVKAPFANATFSHSVGLYTYNDPLNRLVSITGFVELSLIDASQKELAHLTLPLKQQATFVDSQLIPDYSRLEYSKLKKELKIGSVPQNVLASDWVGRNVKEDLQIFLAENHYINSEQSYNTQDRLLRLQSSLSVLKAQRDRLQFERARILLKYLLGGVQASGSKKDAEGLIKTFLALAEPLRGTPKIEDLITRQFYAIQNAKTDSPAYLVKETLRVWMLKTQKPPFLRTYLSDIDYLMRSRSPSGMHDVTNTWLGQWTEGKIKSNFDEFETQARIFHSVLQANIAEVDGPLLDALQKVGDLRLAQSPKPEETLYEIALERLDTSKALVAAYRFAEAKGFLKNSYAGLKLDQLESTAAAKEIFIKDAALLGDRIAFAEQTLRGSAGTLDEGAFMDYLNTQERDKTLEERFSSFIEGKQAPEEATTPPSIAEVSQRFSSSRIIVLDEDITPVPDFTFEFTIKNARLLDRAPDGSALVFSAHYEFTTNAITDIILNDKPFAGSFTLDDFVRLAIVGPDAIPTTSTEPSAPIGDFLGTGQGEEATRSQVVAQDLSVQLVVDELNSYGILIASTQQVSVVNPATLTEFRVSKAQIEDLAKKRTATVSFNFDSVSKAITSILIEGSAVPLPDEIQAQQFVTTVFTGIYGKEDLERAIKAAVSELGGLGFVLAPADFKFTDTQLTIVEFSKIRLKELPVEFSGIYDRTSKLFVKAENPLLSLMDVAPKEYASQLATLYIIETLGTKDISITPDNIVSTLPAERVDIRNYVRGDKILNFTYDVANNRLLNVMLKGSTTSVKSMTFEEFSLIVGEEVVAPSTPALPTVETTPSVP